MAKNPAVNTGDARDMGLISGLDRSSEYRKWLLTPVFLCGKSHGQRRLVGYSPWDCKESDKTKQITLSLLTTNFLFFKLLCVFFF